MARGMGRGTALGCILLSVLALAACGGGSSSDRDKGGGSDNPTQLDVAPGELGEDAVLPDAASDEGGEDRLQGEDSLPGEDAQEVDAQGEDTTVGPCRPGDACDDRDPCTFDDRCDGDGACHGTLNAECDDGIDCTADSCTPTECKHVPKPGHCLVDGKCFDEGQTDPAVPCASCITAVAQDVLTPDDLLPCDDGDSCTTGDRCLGGLCVGGPMDCDDHNACTSDSCVDGSCVHAAVDGACDDGSLCTEADHCLEGACVGTPVTCWDQNGCTTDECVPALGCVHSPADGPCDDGNICTVGDHCFNGGCKSGQERLQCDDGNLCTDDACTPSKGCVYIPNTEPCDDGDPCTVGDQCRKAACQPGLDTLPCDDGNLCTDDSCQAGFGCVAVNNQAPCDDGEPCHLDDVCSNGACVPGPTPLACDDGNECTDDSCKDGVGCVFENNTAPCDDNNVCTWPDVCGDGACIGNLQADCNDENDCTADWCDPTGGGCMHKPLPICRPQIIIDYPPRGATLDPASTVIIPEGDPNAGLRGVWVRGHIEYPKPGFMVTEIKRNGVRQLVWPMREGWPDWSFDFYMPVQQGASHIVVDTYTVLLDGSSVTADFNDHVVQSYYYSTKWWPVNDANPGPGMVPDGLMIFMGQATWNMLADVLEKFMGTLNLSTLISNPVTSGSFGWCKYKVNITHIQYGSVSVALDPTWGGINFKATIPNFRADIDVPVSGFLCPDFSGSASASSIVIAATLTMAIDANGNPTAAIKNPDVTVNGLNVDIDGIWGFLFNWIIDFFEDNFATMIEDQFESMLAGTLSDTIAKAIANLSINQQMALPAFLPGMESFSVRIASKFSTIEFSPGAGVMGMAATVTAPKKVSYNPLGSIGRASCLGAQEPKLAFPRHGPLEIGLYDDFINQILYSLWYGGGLHIPVPASMLGNVDLSQYGISDLNLVVDFMLPPILSSCVAGDKLFMQVGDVGVHATMKLFGQLMDMQLFASLDAEAKITAVDKPTGKELALAVEKPLFIDIEIASIAGGLVGAEDKLGGMFKDVLIPQVMKLLSGQVLASFPIPEIDLAALAPGIPAGTKIAIDLKEVLRIYGYTVASGGLK